MLVLLLSWDLVHYAHFLLKKNANIHLLSSWPLPPSEIDLGQRMDKTHSHPDSSIQRNHLGIYSFIHLNVSPYFRRRCLPWAFAVNHQSAIPAYTITGIGKYEAHYTSCC
jgi:hypothetical protein